METLTQNSAEQAVVSEKLFEVFKKFEGRNVFFIEPGGNFGDHLIYKGAYKLARLSGVRAAIMTFDDFEQKTFTSDEIVYVHGGGGFVPWWSGKPMKMLKRLSDQFRGTLILGPTTFSEDESYIKNVFNECISHHQFKEFYIFTRDELSFEILNNHLPCKAEVACDHDTALNLVKGDLINEKQSPAKYTLYAMRHDKGMPKDQPYDYLGWLDPIDVSRSFDEWLQFHWHARQIITNRTHSTIVGTILGIPTVMLPNSYHKNRSVWERSLKKRGVQWLDRLEAGGFNKFIESNEFLKRKLTSSKFRKLLKLRLNVLGF